MALGPFLVLSTICAFCLITSAGVRMAQETSSATEEAVACMMGCGSKGDEPDSVGLRSVNTDFTPSYVVKNAPAL